MIPKSAGMVDMYESNQQAAWADVVAGTEVNGGRKVARA
jgi:hypothetical protein